MCALCLVVCGLMYACTGYASATSTKISSALYEVQLPCSRQLLLFLVHFVTCPELH